MGAVAAEANFWARISDNQPPPDSQARVRFLLDEIALLQSRFDSKDHRPNKFERVDHASPNKEEVVSILPENKNKEEVVSILPAIESRERTEDENHAVVSDSNQNQGVEILVKSLEDKVRSILDERVWFFDKAEKELRAGKVDKSELATLLQLEKSKLQRHRSELESLRRKIVYSTVGAADQAQDIVGKLGSLLDERESLHMKFEVQVELGHFFRLLKLLELQKARHEVSKREFERNLQNLKDRLEQIKSSDPDRDRDQDLGTDMEIKDHSEQDLEEIADSAGDEIKIAAESSSDLDLHQEACSRCRKEARSEVLKLMSDQEQQWRTQQSVLKEMERRLELAELESQRLRIRFQEAELDCRTENAISISSSSASLPQGYSSIYFSPIFQERKPSMKSPRDERESEIRRLKMEVDELKARLYQKQGDEEKFVDRIQVPSEEKTISIDATSSQEQQAKMPKLFAILHSDFSESMCSEDDKLSSADKIGATKRATHQGNNLHERIHELEDVIQSLRAELSRAADEHAQQLDIKEKTLAYAQALNMRLANDMTSAETALAELRAEHTGLKASFESKIKDSRNEAEEFGLRENIKLLEKQLGDKDRLLSDLNSRVEACQNETDAAVLEKNEVLKRLRRVMTEIENQKATIELDQGRQDQLLSELETARDQLKAQVDEHEALGQRYTELQSQLLETQYMLSQREDALERLTLHLAAAAMQEQRHKLDDSSRESLRSKHRRKERARRSIQEVEEKMAGMAAEMSRAKTEMEELKSESFQLLSARTISRQY